MPQFAANLGFLFQEVDMLARYNAAAGVGFRGVETPFPYSLPPEAFVTRLQSCGLEQVLCNLPPGNWDAGERGGPKLGACVWPRTRHGCSLKAQICWPGDAVYSLDQCRVLCYYPCISHGVVRRGEGCDEV
jgi:hypothetical protein